MTHTNHALHLNAFAGNWTIDQDGTLTIKGRDDRYRGVTFHQPYNTNPLADLPSDKIKALEAGLEALRTLRLSGVDWQRLAAEE